jgi:hypothetical protein
MESTGTATGKQNNVQQDSGRQGTKELLKWQKRLLPVMTLFLIALALAFFVVSTRTLNGVDEFVKGEHGELRDQINATIKDSKPAQTSEDSIRRGLLILEADALDRRYHQASALLMSQIWAKHLAFMTGMIMAFMGAIFILGKLSESQTDVAGGGSQWNVSIHSASPGILLAFFGTVLVALSIVIQGKVDVHDTAAYLRSVIVQTQPRSDASGKAKVDSSDVNGALDSILGDAAPTPAPASTSK